jgi:hypothetical protein
MIWVLLLWAQSATQLERGEALFFDPHTDATGVER